LLRIDGGGLRRGYDRHRRAHISNAGAAEAGSAQDESQSRATAIEVKQPGRLHAFDPADPQRKRFGALEYRSGLG